MSGEKLEGVVRYPAAMEISPVGNPRGWRVQAYSPGREHHSYSSTRTGTDFIDRKTNLEEEAVDGAKEQIILVPHDVIFVP
jgi:hypothetical protein